MGKLDFFQDLMEPPNLPSFNVVTITRQTRQNQTPIDKRRPKTTFDHLRDKPARFLRIRSTDLHGFLLHPINFPPKSMTTIASGEAANMLLSVSSSRSQLDWLSRFFIMSTSFQHSLSLQ